VPSEVLPPASPGFFHFFATLFFQQRSAIFAHVNADESAALRPEDCR
jgi:hypothetical protein